MSAIKNERIVIDVTMGDCLEPNRKNGKSNTGTYFISSVKDFDEYKAYFEKEDVFVINLIKVKEYIILFKELFVDKMSEYNGKGEGFDSFSKFLLSQKANPRIEITLRINDSRVFMKFKDNSNDIVNAFRNLLYENISYICIEKITNLYEVYPMIAANKINLNSDIIVDSFNFDD